jgi:hypothetical protein
MVELKGALVAPVAAERAAATSLLDQEFFHPPAPSSYRLHATTSTSHPTGVLEHEDGFAVPLAVTDHRPFTAAPGRIYRRSPNRDRLGELISRDPMPNGCGADAERVGDCANGATSGNELTKDLAIGRTFGGVLCLTDRHEIELLKPVGDRGWVTTHDPSDALKREPLLKPDLKLSAIHPWMIACASDRNTNIRSWEPKSSVSAVRAGDLLVELGAAAL